MKKKRLIIRDTSGKILSPKDQMDDAYDSDHRYSGFEGAGQEMQVTAIQPVTVVNNGELTLDYLPYGTLK